jgi:hypothetical protein
MILRLLNWQGIAGLAATIGIGLLLIIQKVETAHWKKQSASFEQLYRQEQSALATTVANYRAAADQARTADQANATRVAADQSAINERTANDFETRLAAARADAADIASGRLRVATQAAADSGAGGNAPVSGLPAPPGGPAQASGQDRLPQSDALTATEQAIQLDELVKWVKAQAAVDPNDKKK